MIFPSCSFCHNGLFLLQLKSVEGSEAGGGGYSEKWGGGLVRELICNARVTTEQGFTSPQVYGLLKK